MKCLKVVMTILKSENSVKNFWAYLTSIKSPGKLTIRWKGALQITPKKYLFNFIIFDTLRIILRYFKSIYKVKFL